MDLLEDVLKIAGLKRRILHQHALTEPWRLQFPCPSSIGFHVVTQGEAYLWPTAQAQPLPLRQGDIAFMARGTHHAISTRLDGGERDIAIDSWPQEHARQRQLTPLVGLVSGAYQLWYEPLHPLFAELPAWVIIPAESVAYHHSIQHLLQILAPELEQPDWGSSAIVESLLDVLFRLILRRILQTETIHSKSWLQASQDPQIYQALVLMHQDPSESWSLAALAQAVGMSRSGFALKFKQGLGESPLQYLNRLRMLRAMDSLSQSADTLEAVARSVGYRDAFGFSKSFKKLVGVSPKVFRQQQRQSLAAGLRFS